MKIAFLSESPYTGKYPAQFDNIRTEIAWQIALDADHFNIYNSVYDILNNKTTVAGYDHVFIIFPKGRVFLSAEGLSIMKANNPVSDMLHSNFVSALKTVNSKVHFVQEGPHWWFNDYAVDDQIYFYNMISQFDSIFAHNKCDVNYYKGLFPTMQVQTIGTLMFDDLLKDVIPTKEDKVIIGGNFAHWYGGFESYIVASGLGLPIWTQTSHATREFENSIANLTHLPRLSWLDWMRALSEFKYAVHLMPTVAAGTFSLNCAYFGIACIGNRELDTQRICHPALSVDIADVKTANELMYRLKTDDKFYEDCSTYAKNAYDTHYSVEVWKETIKKYL